MFDRTDAITFCTFILYLIISFRNFASSHTIPAHRQHYRLPKVRGWGIYVEKYLLYVIDCFVLLIDSYLEHYK